MRYLSHTIVLALLVSCGLKNGDGAKAPQCSDGIDNDGDGLIDFPDDPGCVSPDDDSEDSPPSPQCSDGRDNDGDGKIDYPDDPGCFSPNADSEVDDCPDGPMCPQCGNGLDDDGNGLIDYPADPGCTSASDDSEFSPFLTSCGSTLTIKQLPTTGVDKGNLNISSTSMIASPCGGGAGSPAVAYAIYLREAKVIVASTDDPATIADTVIDIRSMDCNAASSEVGCNNDVGGMTGDLRSTVTQSLPAGLYYLIVEGHDVTSLGDYTLSVKLFNGEGTPCTDPSTCGAGLVCRIPLNGTAMVCSKPECSDGVDNDGDGKIDYPDDPGCSSPDDNDETDDCPTGPNCPECGNGKDDDGDGKIDYPADTSCKSAGDVSEECNSLDNVIELTMPVTAGDTTNSHDDVATTCAESTGGLDDIYQLEVPALDSLDLAVSSVFSNELELLGHTCGGTALVCVADNLPRTNLAAGTYYLVVDSDEADDFGAYTITTTGKIKNGQSCESALARSGALTCNTGYVCKGTVGARICKQAACSDGIDNDGDGKIDYPNDPGCTGPDDDDEADTCNTTGVGCPVCSDKKDNDNDGLIDYPADFGCASAAGTSEVFCSPETDPASKIVTAVTTGTTAGKHNDLTPTCSTSSAPDVSYGLSLPVPVATLVIDTIGSAFDTVLTVRTTSCAMELACDDDGGGGANNTSKITMTNVLAGNYAVNIDGYTTNAGAYKLNVKGTVATGTVCTSPMFAAGLLVCPGTTHCTSGTCH